MKLTKRRVESFSDGVISIIITIMVLSIPLPYQLDMVGVRSLLFSIFVYFISFIVVGTFWRQHHLVFSYIDDITTQVVTYNILFLFFLSLIPIFTKWVMHHPDALIPVIGYALVYLLTWSSYLLIFLYGIKHSAKEEMMDMRKSLHYKQYKEKTIEAYKKERNLSWLRFMITAGIIVFAIAISIHIPEVATFCLLGLPVGSSILNFLLGDDKKRQKRIEEYQKSVASS